MFYPLSISLCDVKQASLDWKVELDLWYLIPLPCVLIWSVTQRSTSNLCSWWMWNHEVEMRWWVLVVCLELGQPYLYIRFNSGPFYVAWGLWAGIYVEEIHFKKKNPEKVCIRKSRLVGSLDASITIGTYFPCFLDHSSSSEWQKLIACFFRVSLVCDDMMNVLCTRPNRRTMAQDNTLNGCWLYRRNIKSTLSVPALEEVCERIDFEQKWGWRSQQHIHLYLVGLEGLDSFPFLSSIFHSSGNRKSHEHNWAWSSVEHQ